MLKIKKISVLLLTFIMILTAVSCGAENSVADDTSEPLATATLPALQEEVYEPAPGGVLRLASLKYSSLNPLTTDSEDIRQYMSLVFSDFVSLDYSGRPTSEVAESWESSDGFITWTFKLKQGISWHDGGIVDAEDVLATISAIKSKGGNYADNIKKIKSAEALDEFTLKIVCQEACALLPCMLKFPVLKCENINTVGTMPVGSGMYEYDYAKSSAGKVYLKRFDGYYGNKPYIDAVEITTYENDVAKYSAESDFSIVYDGVVKSAYIRENVHSYDFTGNLLTMLYFNLNGAGNYGAVKESAVRNAISCYLDRENLISAGASGNAEPAVLPVLNGNYIFSDKYQQDKSLIYKGDNLLSEAGYAKNESGMWAKDGTVLDFVLLLLGKETESVLLAERIEKNLEKNGVSVTIKYCTAKEYADFISGGTYSAAVKQVKLNDWLDFESFYKKGSKNNLNGYANESFDALLANADVAPDDEAMIAMYKALADVLNTELPACGIYLKNQRAIVSDMLHGISETGLYSWDVFAFADKWYIE